MAAKNKGTRKVLKPFRPTTPTRWGAVVLGAIWLWTAFWVIASGVVALARDGSAPDQTMACLAVLGFPAWCAVLFGWRLPGIRRLYPEPRPMAVVSDEGLELHIPSIGVRAFRWDEIGSLSRGRRGRGVLRSPAGKELTSVPSNLMTGWCSLAQAVASARGDRYEAIRSWRFGPRIYLRSRGLPGSS
jgi:hypothetical protein